MALKVIKKILIVEDDLGYRKPLGDFLSAHGFNISTADNGEMAMERLLFHHPDLVILDLLLPKVDGFQVLKRFRDYPNPEIASVPVIVLSNLSSAKDLEAAVALNISAYFVKSETTRDDILNKVNEILFPDGKPPEQEALDFSKIQL